jgi:egghead protein (zeste-white 4 protein)
MGTVLVGMKGSFMVIPHSTEKRVGFDHGPEASITEDAWFAFCIGKIYWCEGVLLEQSPFTLMDLIKQRRRWATGLWKVIMHHPVGWHRKIILASQMLAWVLSPFTWLSLICGFALFNYEVNPYLMVRELRRGRRFNTHA